MADFRRCFIALAALALLLGAVGTASAQSQALTCNASAVPTQDRSQGEAEPVGDVLLQCTGGTPTAVNSNDPLVNFQVFLNAAVTSRLVTASTGASEALLIVDDNTGIQNFCALPPCQNIGGGSIVGSPYVLPGNKNVFYGTWNANQPNSITFAGIPIDAPGTSGGTRTFRITNIRANASQFNAVGTTANPSQITETVSVSGSNPSIPINNPQQVVGLVLNGLVVKNATGGPFGECNSINVNGAGTKLSIGTLGVGNAGIITIQKGFANAFRVRNSGVLLSGSPNNSPSDLVTATPTAQNTPGNFNVSTETMFYNPGFPAPFGGTSAGAAGLADFGTRIAILFANVPKDAHVYVPIKLSSASPLIPGTNPPINYVSPALAQLSAVLVSSESGAASLNTTVSAADATGNPAAYGLAEVALTGGACEAIYEINAVNAGSSTEQFNVPVTTAFIANPGSNSPAFGQATVGVSFAPRIADTVAEDASVAVPRFIDTSVQGNIFAINACSTTLLFPFVTNQAGFDTGIAIANTSADPFGTSNQTGACTLTPFGTPKSTAFTSPTAGIAAGTVYANLASIMFPGFQGYVFAVCNFQYAHGFAFIEGNGVAQGYLALVVPGSMRPNAASPFDLAGPGSGEQLGF